MSSHVSGKSKLDTIHFLCVMDSIIHSFNLQCARYYVGTNCSMASKTWAWPSRIISLVRDLFSAKEKALQIHCLMLGLSENADLYNTEKNV